MAGALCYGSTGGGCCLALHFQPGSYNTETLIGVLANCTASWPGRRSP
jgi:hypothetical protein